MALNHNIAKLYTIKSQLNFSKFHLKKWPGTDPQTPIMKWQIPWLQCADYLDFSQGWIVMGHKAALPIKTTESMIKWLVISHCYR